MTNARRAGDHCFGYGFSIHKHEVRGSTRYAEAIPCEAEGRSGAMRHQLERFGKPFVGPPIHAIRNQHGALQLVRIAKWPPRVANVVGAAEDTDAALQ